MKKKIRRLQCFFILSRERLWRSNSTENDLGSHASKEKLYSSHLYQIDTWMKNFLIQLSVEEKHGQRRPLLKKS